jgi:hypothetical protein
MKVAIPARRALSPRRSAAAEFLLITATIPATKQYADSTSAKRRQKLPMIGMAASYGTVIKHGFGNATFSYYSGSLRSELKRGL